MRNAIFAATLVFSSAAVFGVTDNLREQAESSSNANMTEVKQVELAGSGGNVAGEKNLKRAASISHIFLEDVEKIKEIRKANAESVRALWSEKVSGSKISEMEIEIEELKKKNKDLKSYIESLTHSFDYMTEEMLFWKNSYQPNMKKIARLTNELENMKNYIFEQDKENASLKQENNLLKKQSEIFFEENEKVKEANKRLKKESELFKEKKAKEIADLNNENKDLKSYIESLTHSFDNMTEEMLFWKNSYQPNMKKIARLTNKLEKTKAELKENIEDRRSDINWWKDQYDERVREIENLTKKIKLLSDKLERKERIIQELKNGKSIIKEIDNLSINSDSTAFD